MTPAQSPIVMPYAQRWRFVRRQYLPAVVFACAIAATVLLWRESVAPSTFLAEVESQQTEVRSALPGRLMGIKVDLLESVQAGQIIGELIHVDPAVFAASIAVLRAEVALELATMEPVVNQQRVALDYGRLQMEWMQQRVELASLRGQLLQAEAEVSRLSALHHRQLVTDQEFEIARNARDTLLKQVEEQQALIATIEPRLHDLASHGGSDAASPQNAFQAAIDLQKEKVRLAEAELKSIELRAPASGIITGLFRRSGESVASGEPIARITSEKSNRLVGFIRQPISVEPQPGMVVEVRTRAPRRSVGHAVVLQVGPAMEPILPSLAAALRLPNLAEMGLRVHVSHPEGLVLRPGEHVDAILRP